MTNNNDAMTALYSEQNEGLAEHIYGEGEQLAAKFLAQMDAYYASPTASFHDDRIARNFYQQRINHIGFKPYPKDGLVTFGASGTNLCDRQLVFKNAKVRTEKTPDIPFRSRQRRVGSAVIEYVQLDIAHMKKRLGAQAVFNFATLPNGEWAFEDAMQVRQVIEHNGVKFAITVKPDGILDYSEEKGRRFIFEYKTKASGIVEMNNKLDFSGPQTDHLRQVTAEAIVYGINEGFIVYESVHKPAWFSDEDKKAVPKTRKTWRDGEPVPDMRVFYFRITDEMKNDLLNDLARQAALVYSGDIPDLTVDMTSKCGFCSFKSHCKAELSDDKLDQLKTLEHRYAKSSMAEKLEHRNLRNYLS